MKKKTATQGYRPIHYMGGKARYLSYISEAISEVAIRNLPVCDLFSGTGVVSRELAEERGVVSSDIQQYSKVLTDSLISPKRISSNEEFNLWESYNYNYDLLNSSFVPLVDLEDRAIEDADQDARLLADIVELGSMAHPAPSEGRLATAKAEVGSRVGQKDATIAWNYGGVYFSYSQALSLDAMRFAINHALPPSKQNTALSALLSAASMTVSTVGSHFAQPLRPRGKGGQIKPSFVRSVRTKRQTSVAEEFRRRTRHLGSLDPAPYECKSIVGDYRDVLADLRSVGAVYADPPYTREHYSRFYHVLETIARGDSPEITSTPGSGLPSRGLYRTDRHQSPFGIPSKAHQAFDELMASVRNLEAPLVLSYSPRGPGTASRADTRLMDLPDLRDMAYNYFSWVETRTIDGSFHSQFNTRKTCRSQIGDQEVIMIASP